MTAADFLQSNNWMIALTVAVGVISWAVLILQALFNDKRIALVGVFGSLLFSFTFLFPAVIPQLIKYTATLLCFVFFVWFLIKHVKKPVVYMAALGVMFSSVSGWWLYQGYQALL